MSKFSFEGKCDLSFAILSDLHMTHRGEGLQKLHQHFALYAKAVPSLDLHVFAGDIVYQHDLSGGGSYDKVESSPYEYLRIVREKYAKEVPLVYAIGNHEWKSSQREEYWPHVKKSRVTVLDNTFTVFEGIVLGGLSSAPKAEIHGEFLPRMAAQPGYKLLMCHHPEWFEKHVAPHAIDLTLSGHAHGGQVRIFGQGLYAPNQGILPKLTSGWYFDKRLLVSRGMTNSARAPRLNDPCELILLHLKGLNDE